LLLTALAVAAVAAPAAGAPGGWGVVTVGGGDISTTGSGSSTGHQASASCSYTGSTLSLVAETHAAEPEFQSISARCHMVLGGVSYAVSAADAGSAVQVIDYGYTHSVPAGTVAPTRVCLEVAATWPGDTFHHYRCVTPGAYGWFDRFEVAVPLGL
jgi:hypothetical protein